MEGGGNGGDANDDGNGGLGGFSALPEGFIASALSRTNPRDACRLSLVGSMFRSAAEWDAVWEGFLPSDYHDIIASASLHPFASKKELFLHLCDHPLLIDAGTKSFSLDKWSGKKCYMLGARDLSIVWGDTPRYWKWISAPDSRFGEVAQLITVCWLEIHGKISTSMLSPDTNYAAHLVFKWTEDTYGFEDHPAEVYVQRSGCEAKMSAIYLGGGLQRRRTYPWPYPTLVNSNGRFVRHHLFGPTTPVADDHEVGVSMPNKVHPRQRGDGWLEIELGEYKILVEDVNDDDGELDMCFAEVKGGNWKGGLIVQGIEIRPKWTK